MQRLIASGRAAICALAFAGMLVFSTPAGADEQVVAAAPGAMGLTAYGGYVVWSSPVARGWRLVSWHAGTTRTLPVPARRVPFDADVGPDAHGRPTVIYSRCTRDPTTYYSATAEWATARGCDIWGLALAGGRPRPIAAVNTAAGSETTPSMWRGAIAFQRRSPGHRASIVLVRPRRGRMLHLPRGTLNGDFPKTKPTAVGSVSALDLGSRVLAFVWLLNGPAVGGNDHRAWELWLDPLSGHTRIPVDAGEVGECNFQEPLTPNARGVGVLWTRALDICGSPTQSSSTITTYDAPTRTAAQATTTGFALAAARDGTATTWWLRGTGTFVGAPGLGYIPNPTICPGSATPCELMRSTPLTFTPFQLQRPTWLKG